MNPIDKAWIELLAKQRRERQALVTAQEDQRAAFYREHGAHFATRPVFDPKRDWREP